MKNLLLLRTLKRNFSSIAKPLDDIIEPTTHKQNIKFKT